MAEEIKELRTSRIMTYASAGVDYGAVDLFKRMAQIAGRETAGNIKGEFKEMEWSRGESVYLIEAAKNYFAQVEEGLGTKNLVADAMYPLVKMSYYDRIAQDTVAMIVNDMITLGALPLSVAMHLAVGGADWFNDEQRCRDLVNGWKYACYLARCAWGGGETPILKDIVTPGACMLSGSAIGLVKPKKRLIKGDIRHGDAIILVESSGIHANGLTLARRIAEKLPQGYLTKIGNEEHPDHTDCGRYYGDALLDPTFIYVPLIKECLNRGINIHYAVNITGHGWRKLMRAKDSFAYVVEILPKCPQIFSFIQRQGPVDDREAYGNLNMGAGFALYVAERDAGKVIEANEAVARVNFANRYCAFVAGHIERSEIKRVIIKPKELEYSAESLAIR